MPEFYWDSDKQAFAKECPTCATVYLGNENQAMSEVVFARDFRTDRNTKDGYYGICKTCVSARQRSSREGRICDPDALLAAQDGRCGICEKEISFAKKLMKVTAYVDHNHATNRVRGILCVRCNSMLGSKEWILKALAYLEKHDGQNN